MSFSDLPGDIWKFIIFRELSKNDLASMMATCRSICKIIKEDKFLQGRMKVYTISELFTYDGICLPSIPTEDGNFYEDEEYGFINSPHVYCLRIDSIDRGIENFQEFTDDLKYQFPNLRELSFSQNYSYCKDNTCYEFLMFIENMNLCHLNMTDQQSDYLSTVKADDILRAMPDYANYKIGLNLNHDPDENLYNYGMIWDRVEQFLGAEGKKLLFTNPIKK